MYAYSLSHALSAVWRLPLLSWLILAILAAALEFACGAAGKAFSRYAWSPARRRVVRRWYGRKNLVQAAAPGQLIAPVYEVTDWQNDDGPTWVKIIPGPIWRDGSEDARWVPLTTLKPFEIRVLRPRMAAGHLRLFRYIYAPEAAAGLFPEPAAVRKGPS